MPAPVALLLHLLLLLVFLRWAKEPESSSALWLPVIWLFILGSRLPSKWFGISSYESASMASEEGNGFDRFVYLSLLILAICVLLARHFNWTEAIGRNLTLTLFVVFTLASVAWSDYSFVAFKRWVRDLNTYLLVLVVLSDPHPVKALTTVLRRFSYILVILSILLIRYYPGIGITYNFWDGRPEYVGAATSKNTLAVVLMVSGLFLVWDTLGRWPDRKTPRTKRILIANIVLIGLTLRLFMYTPSATSQTCLVLGCLVMILARLKSVQRKPGIVTVALPVTVAAYAVMELMFDISSAVARFLGRDPTLTGRTDTWNALLQLQTNPLLGLGYSSLWIGERLEGILAMLNVSYLNEAHSGYLETYLTLGFVGLFLLAVFLLSSFRALSKHVLISHHFASFAISVWLVTILYNVTESAFGSSLVWNVLLLCVVISRAGGERALKAPSPLQRWTTGRSDLRSRPVAAHVPTTFSHTE